MPGDLELLSRAWLDTHQPPLPEWGEGSKSIKSSQDRREKAEFFKDFFIPERTIPLP
jgi:hypothetical protein